MIKANFNTYASYVTDSVYQWDLNRVLSVSGLNLSVAPEVHFSNANMDKAIVRQATLNNHVVSVKIPNSLIQDPLTIYAHIGIHEGNTFKVVEKVEIPVIRKERPKDYQIETSDEEIYSFKALENALANKADAATINARVDNIIAHNNDTESNSELVDIRVDMDGNTHTSAGSAFRSQGELLKKFDEGIVAEAFTCDFNLFENGSWNHEDVKSNSEVYRVRTKDAIYFPYTVSISIADGFQVRGYWCNDAGESVELFTWVTTPIVVDANRKVKLVIARVAEVSTETADIAEFVNALSVKSGLRVEVDTLRADAGRVRNYVFNLRPDDFVNGWIEGWNNGVLNTTPKYRVVTPYVMRFSSNVVIYAKNGFRFALNYWKNGEFVSDELWQTEFNVPAEQDFKMMIGRVTENSSEIADVNEFVSQIYVISDEEKYMQKVDSLEEKFSTLAPKNKEVYSVNHRGYNTIAPENTLAAFKLSKKNGFDFVETDLRWTSDGVPVLLHDETINRTARNANGTAIATDIYIDRITYDEASVYDFGVYKSDAYKGTKIPTFEEFITLCRNIGLHPYIEIEGEITAARAATLIEIVSNRGLLDNVSWISFNYESLLRIVEHYPKARVGLNCITSVGFTSNQREYANKLLKIAPNVFYHADTNSVGVCVEMAKEDGLPLEIWCPSTEEEIINLPTYVSGVTTDKLVAKTVLYNAFIN